MPTIHRHHGRGCDRGFLKTRHYRCGSRRKKAHLAQIVPVQSLTDPKTWHVILEHSLQSPHILAQKWKNEIAPSMGISCPIRSSTIITSARPYIAQQLKALGLALERYSLTGDKMLNLYERLVTCDETRIFLFVKLLEEYLGLRE
jgi:hypothetical protein